MPRLVLFPFFLLLLISQNTSFAQLEFNWAYQFGSTVSDNPGNAFVDSDGNIFLMAEYDGQVDMDPGLGTDLFTPPGEYILLLTKFNKDGEYQWSRPFSDGGNMYFNLTNIQADKIYLSGYFTDSLVYGTSGNAVTFQGNPGLNGFILILDLNGDVYDFKAFTIADDFYLIDIIPLPDGDLLAAGGFSDTVYLDGNTTISNGKSDALFIRFSSDLSTEWVRTIGSTDNDFATDIYYRHDFLYYAVGYEDDIVITTATGDVALSSNGEGNIVFGTIQPNGTFQYAQGIGGNGNEEINSIIVDEFRNVIIAGSFEDTVNFASLGEPEFLATSTSGNLSDGFIAKYDVTGSLVWFRQIEDENYGGIYNAGFGYQDHLYLFGNFNGNADLDPGPTAFPVNTVERGDMYILKLDPDGIFEWAYTFPGNDFEGMRSLKMGSNGRMYAYGYFYNALDANPLPFEELLMVSGGGADVFLSAFTEEGIISAGKEITSKPLYVFPNPVHDIVYVDAGSPVSHMYLFDQKGSLAGSIKCDGNTFQTMSLKDLAPGMYVLKTISQDAVMTSKIMKL